jgi:hypothetical protein
VRGSMKSLLYGVLQQRANGYTARRSLHGAGGNSAGYNTFEEGVLYSVEGWFKISDRHRTRSATEGKYRALEYGVCVTRKILLLRLPPHNLP